MRQILGQPSLSPHPCPLVAPGFLLQQELTCGALRGDGWLQGDSRRRWGQCCCLIYMPTAGVVLGQAHPGCLSGWLDQHKANFKARVCCQFCAA